LLEEISNSHVQMPCRTDHESCSALNVYLAVLVSWSCEMRWCVTT